MQLKQPSRIIHWVHIYKLYLEAFPIYERKPFSMILSKYKDHKADVWYLEKNNTFVGLAITLNSDDLILLDYFAIDQKHRAKGLGSESLQFLKMKYKEKKLFAEIESVYEDVDNIKERIKRKQFYLKNGMKEVNIFANCFGTNMEIISYDKSITFNDYQYVYFDNYGQRGLNNIKELTYSNRIKK